MTRLIPVSLLLLSLVACGGGDSAEKSTTKLDAVEVEPGTISDSMIVLDDTNVDGTAIDNSVPTDGGASKKPEQTDDAEAGGAEATPANDDPDAVPAPAARTSVRPDKNKSAPAD